MLGAMPTARRGHETTNKAWPLRAVVMARAPNEDGCASARPLSGFATSLYNGGPTEPHRLPPRLF
jgi:hypothetical protein